MAARVTLHSPEAFSESICCIYITFIPQLPVCLHMIFLINMNVGDASFIDDNVIHGAVGLVGRNSLPNE